MDMAGRRVLLTTTHKNIRSGGSVQLFLLARSLVKAGAHVEALFNFKAGTTLAEANLNRLTDLGVPVRFLRFSRWYSPAQIARLRGIVRAGKFDVVHTHKGSDLSMALLALPGLGVPALLNTRGVNFRLGANRYKYRSARLDRIIVVSRDSKNVMVDCGVPAEKIQVIYGGVDTDLFRPLPAERDAARAELDLPGDATVSVVAANLVRQKGHGDYLQAVARLRQSHAGLWHVFAGGGDQAELRVVAAELGVADRVVFAGFRPDMQRVYAAADFSVMPSFAGEGVSGVLREALACGKAVVTTDVGGNAELVIDGEFGLVVPRHDPPALAAAMARLCDEPGLAARLAEAGQRLVVENHSADARARRIFDLYGDICRANGKA
jgi:glycosyltransferase involved in cell wall biosynthesis